MVNNHCTKFGDHRHCGSEDIMFFVVEKQDSTCLLKFTINVYL